MKPNCVAITVSDQPPGAMNILHQKAIERKVGINCMFLSTPNRRHIGIQNLSIHSIIALLFFLIVYVICGSKSREILQNERYSLRNQQRSTVPKCFSWSTTCQCLVESAILQQLPRNESRSHFSTTRRILFGSEELFLARKNSDFSIFQ